ncbi:MAG: sigma-54 interaction domain-containing protein [Bacillota bacterium]
MNINDDINKTTKHEEKIKILDRDKLIFQKILDISADGFLVVDKNGYITEINKAYSDFLGMKRDEIVGRYITDVVKNSKLPVILSTGETEVNVLHELVVGQSPKQDRYVIVTRAAVKDGSEVIAAVGQIKFAEETMKMAEKLKEMDMELQYYKSELKRIARSKYSFDSIIGQNEAFLEAKNMAQKAAKNDLTVLILGETGTGKEIFANAIHYASNRKNKPFIRVNCAAIPSDLLESELFGYEEGSFTGAKKEGKKGKFELANGGTVFLDEIGDMPLNMQSKILRVLQEKEIDRVGGHKTTTIDVRVIAATNQNLEENLQKHTFRADLYYRLNVIQIKIPPLRERAEDIQLFINHFLDQLNNKNGTCVKLFPEAVKILNNYTWPGNVRELKNVIERSYCLTEGNAILASHLPPNIFGKSKISSYHGLNNNSFGSIIEQIERELLLEILTKNNFNIRQTSIEMGIHRSTLYKKFERLNIILDNTRGHKNNTPQR